ncbi:MAG: tetratricopeptide repeat protein [Sedimentisphaerales bacterium]|nr:tetratricopeptide repeat protein [Sedimentisphaerales bacterium]
MRNKVKLLILVVTAAILTCGCGEFAKKSDTGLQLKDGYDPNALVLLVHLDHRQNENLLSWPRVAVAIGDGTILLTAKHCVKTPAKWSERPMSSEIIAISPYYGDIYKCRVLATDDKADLAILKADWQAHPALALADEEEFQETRQITVFSRPIRKPKQPHQLGRRIRTTTLSIEQRDVTKPIVGLKLRGAGPIVRGWSGSPMLIPESAKVTGVISALTGMKLGLSSLLSVTFVFDAVGSNVESVWELLRQNDLQYVAKSFFPASFEPVADAEPAFSGIMDYFEILQEKDTAESLVTAEKLVSLRPESSYAHLFLAMIANKMAFEPDAGAQRSKDSREEFLALADSSFKKALQLDPDNASTRAAYGNYLMRRHRNAEALVETESALTVDPNNQLAEINQLILLTQTEPNRAEEYARRLIEKDPNNSHYRYYYGFCLSECGKNEQALEAIQKAIELNPKAGYRGGLADILVKLDRLDEAEKNYKKMTKSCGCQQCWFKYAGFLIGHQPKKLKQAEKALAKAESKAHTMRISKNDMAMLKLNLVAAKFSPLEKKTPQKAEALARKLIKKSPQDGYNFWALAGALREQGRFDDAAEAAGHAVRLCPDCLFRPRLANCLTKAGELEKAEQTYDQMLEMYPDRAKYLFWYAEFLVDNFPDRIDEAKEALGKMETSESRRTVKDEELNPLLEKIAAKEKKL